MPKVESIHAQPGLNRWVGLAVLVIILDQVTKVMAEATMAFGQRINLLPVFDLTLLYNTGAAFSFLAEQPGWQRWFFTVVALLAIAFITYLMRKHRGETRFLFALSLILGGAIGNLIDRVLYGHVIDFLLFYWEKWHYPAFNLADSAITIGAAVLIIDEITRLRKKKDTDHTDTRA